LVKKDVVARSAVQDAIGRLAPAGALVSHQIITIGAAEIGIRIVSTQTIDPIRVRQARDVLSRRTGRKVDISVDAVASKDELRAVLERIATPAPAPPQPAAPPTLSELRDRTVAIVGPRVKELWPAEELPILGYEVAYGDAGCTVRVGYQARREIGPEAVAVLQRVLWDELRTPDLIVELRRQSPAARRK
jgi:hypothetical protein